MKTTTSIALAVAFMVHGMVGGISVYAGPVIYDNGGPDLVTDPDSLLSDFDISAPFTVTNQTADDFALQSGNNTIRDIHWWGIYLLDNTPGTDDFTIRIFEDDGGKPSAINFQTVFTGNPGRADTGFDHTPLSGLFIADLYEYWVEVPALTLTAGTTYWLSIVNNTSDDDNDTWAWVTSSTGGGGNGHERAADGDVWTVHAPETGGREYAFNLTVPEPTGFTLCLGALAGVILLKVRQR